MKVKKPGQNKLSDYFNEEEMKRIRKVREMFNGKVVQVIINGKVI